MNDKLRGKLAEWAGFQWLEATDGTYHWFDANGDIVSPTDEDGNVIWDMNACFKWLVPKLQEHQKDKWSLFDIDFFLDGDWITCRLEFSKEGEMGLPDNLVTLNENYTNNPALALCLAIEKLIDGEK